MRYEGWEVAELFPVLLPYSFREEVGERTSSEEDVFFTLLRRRVVYCTGADLCFCAEEVREFLWAFIDRAASCGLVDSPEDVAREILSAETDEDLLRLFGKQLERLLL